MTLKTVMSYDAENSALITGINYILQYIIENILNCNNILKMYCIFYQITAALVNIRDFFQKHQKKLLFQTCDYVCCNIK